MYKNLKFPIFQSLDGSKPGQIIISEQLNPGSIGNGGRSKDKMQNLILALPASECHRQQWTPLPEFGNTSDGTEIDVKGKSVGDLLLKWE